MVRLFCNIQKLILGEPHLNFLNIYVFNFRQSNLNKKYINML